MKLAITLLSILGLAFAALADPQIGWLAPNFTATDIFGKTIKLSDYKGKIVVLESYKSVGCPFCKVHYKSGAMQELQRELTANGVVWLLVDFEARVVQQTPAKARQDWISKKMAITDWIIDTDGSQVGRMYGMRTAPEAVVIDKRGRLAYQGAVDQFYDVLTESPEYRATLGGPDKPRIPLQELLDARDRAILDADPRKARNYIREAVFALLAGKPVAVPETKPYGCALDIYNH